MRDNYDFSNSIKNPYTKKLKKQIILSMDEDTIEYFKNIADEKCTSYQNIMNLYLRKCAISQS